MPRCVGECGREETDQLEHGQGGVHGRLAHFSHQLARAAGTSPPPRRSCTRHLKGGREPNAGYCATTPSAYSPAANRPSTTPQREALRARHGQSDGNRAGERHRIPAISPAASRRPDLGGQQGDEDRSGVHHERGRPGVHLLPAPSPDRVRTAPERTMGSRPLLHWAWRRTERGCLQHHNETGGPAHRSPVRRGRFTGPSRARASALRCRPSARASGRTRLRSGAA